ncbi:hypothetical protein JCM3770_005195 [Rhodotorula araucariae]
MPDVRHPFLAIFCRSRHSSAVVKAPPSTAPYRILRDDTSPPKSTRDTRTTRFFDSSGDGRAVYSASHVRGADGRFETTLSLSGQGQPVGKVSLHWLQLGASSVKLPASKFYRSRGCLNPVTAFKLGSDWVRWKTDTDGTMRLSSTKNGSVLVVVDPLEHDKSLILPSKSRITLFSSTLFPTTTTCAKGSRPVRPGLPASPPPSFTSTSSASPLASAALALPAQSSPLSLSALLAATGSDCGIKDLELVLLTLLHQDYVRVELAQCKREVQEEQEELRAW